MARLAGGSYADLHAANPFSREMLAFGPSEPLEGARHTRVYQGGVAVMDIAGPIYRHASDASSGAISLSRLSRDLMLARKDERVHKILQVLDTPGGEATALDEYAAKVAEVDKEKPVETYVEGLGASAGYYIAAPSRKITAGRGALIGSIGVVMGVEIPKATVKFTGADGAVEDTNLMIYEGPHGVMYVEIVSSVSPLKRANPMTKEGLDYYMQIVNDTADIFVKDVALYRHLSAEQVPHQYGDGGVYSAHRALSMGLIDDIGSFEAVMDRLAAGYYAPTGQANQTTTTQTTVPAAQAGESDGGVRVVIPVDEDGAVQEPVVTGAGGGTDMSLIERVKSSAAAWAAAGGENRPGGVLPIDEVLAHLEAKRPALEQQFESKALLFVQQLLTAQKPIYNIQEHVAFEMLTALCDDALYGGTVLFAKLGEDGKVAEEKGTREEQCRAKYEMLSKSSLAEQGVRALRDGEVAGHALRSARTEKVTTSEPYNAGVEMTAEEVLGQTQQGQQILAQKTAGQNGNGAAAR